MKRGDRTLSGYISPGSNEVISQRETLRHAFSQAQFLSGKDDLNSMEMAIQDDTINQSQVQSLANPTQRNIASIVSPSLKDAAIKIEDDK